MEDPDDLHQCLTCSTTIVGLENYVAHRRAGCSTPSSAVASPAASVATSAASAAAASATPAATVATASTSASASVAASAVASPAAASATASPAATLASTTTSPAVSAAVAVRVKRPVSLPVIDVKRIVFMSGSGGGATSGGAIPTLKTVNRQSVGIVPLPKKPKVAEEESTKSSQSVTGGETGSASEQKVMNRRSAGGVISIPKKPTRRGGALTLIIPPTEPAPPPPAVAATETVPCEGSGYAVLDSAGEPSPVAAPPASKPASPPVSPSVSTLASPSASPPVSPPASPVPSAKPAASATRPTRRSKRKQVGRDKSKKPQQPAGKKHSVNVTINRCSECNIVFRSRNAMWEHSALAHSAGVGRPSTSRAARKLGKRKPGLREPAWVRSAQEAAAVAGLEPGMQSDDEFGEVEDSLNPAKRERVLPMTRKRKRVTFKRAYAAKEVHDDVEGGDEDHGDEMEDKDDDDGDDDDYADDPGGGDDDDSEEGDDEGDDSASTTHIVVKEEPESPPRHTCPLCGEVPEASLVAHVLSDEHVTSYWAFRASVDDKNYEDPVSKASQLRDLTLEAMTSSAPFAPFRCHPCRFWCNRLEDLRRHLNAPGHWLRRAEKHCTCCGLMVNTSDHLDTPIHERGRVEFVTNSGGFTCGECSATFSLEFAVRRHMSRRHGVDARGGTCDLCRHVMPRDALEDHKRGHQAPRRCETCGKQLNTGAEVEKHFKKSMCQYGGHIRQGKHKCRHCDFRNNLKVNVLFHESLTHHKPHTSRKRSTSDPDDPPVAKDTPAGRLRYLCPQCDLYFRKASLKSHLMKHTGEAPFHCLFCARYFFVESERDYHERTSHQRRQQQEHSPPEELPVPPAKEETSADTPEGADGGDNGGDGDGEEEKTETKARSQFGVNCPICDKKFKNGHAARMHVTREHRGERRTCPVEGCEFSATHASLLNRHVTVRHPNYKRFRCDHCDFACGNAVALETHTNLHTGTKPYKCKHCEFATRFAPHLRRHLRIHTGARPFPCPYCDYRANNFENLRKHVLTTRCHPGLSMYMCKFCPAEDDAAHPPFASNFAREFKQHLREDHADEFETGHALATYVAGLYSREEDVTETEAPIDHVYRQRSKIPKPRRVPSTRRPRHAASASTPTSSATVTVTASPGKQFARGSRGRGQQVLAPRGKLPIIADPAITVTDAAQVLAEVGRKEAERAVAAIDCMEVADSLSLQMVAPPADASLGSVTDDEPRSFASPPLGADAALRSQLADEAADEPRPTRFSAADALVEPAVPQVHIEDQSVHHRTALVRTEGDSAESEAISLETNLPTEITVVHSEETGECSSLLMTFFTDKGSRHVMVPRDVIVHKPGEPVFRRVKVVFTPDDKDGADRVTIHKFYC